MASEITVQASLQVSKTYLAERKQPGQLTVDMAGTRYSANVQSVPTTAGGTALSIGSNVGTAGWAFFRNTDANNYVQVGVQVSGTFYPLLTLKAGEYCVVRLATDTVYALANTAAVDLEFFVLED
jgi:hypothetical protein